MEVTISSRVNGVDRTVTTDRERPLLDVLREDWGLTGAKFGCGEGQCGACTVLIDGRPRRSCITSVSTVDGRSVTTIEGLASNGELHPVQQAFLEEGALQCGYCTPGMILSTVALLGRNPDADDEQIITALDGNICRCNGYVKVMEAVRGAARKLRS
jgi:aerobic carbon-monoxide dehydrogenase small subunit